MSENLFDLSGLEMLPLFGDLHWSYRAGRVLHVASALDVFTKLAGRTATADEIAAWCQTDPGMTEKLLIACCALGLVEKESGRYRNSLLAETYLVQGRPLYQGNIIAHSAEVWRFWDKLDAVVRTGRRDAPLQETDAGDGHRHFILGMHNLSICGPAQMVARNVDLSESKRLLDVGGGPGTYSIAFCQRYPGLEAVIFDLPQTLEVAREVVMHFGLSDRIHLQPGDWDENDFGEGYDAILFSNVLHGAGSQAPMKLEKAYRAMNQGGHLIVQDFLLNNEKTGPLLPALFNVMVGAYSLGEMEEVIASSGFVGAHFVAESGRGHSLVVARKP